MVVFVFVLLSGCMLCWLDRWRGLAAAAPAGSMSRNSPRIIGYYFFAVVIILFFAICRADMVGTDLNNYKVSFEAVRSGSAGAMEPAYAFLETFVARLGGDFHIFLAVCAILTFSPMLYVLYREVDSYLWLGMLIFIAEAYASGFTLLRGSLSYACLYLAYYLKNRRWFAYAPFLLLAFLFHYSSLALIVVFLLMDRKFNFYYYLLAGMGALLLMQSEPVVMHVSAFLPKYKTYFLRPEMFQSYVPALNFFLFGVLTVLCWIYRDKLLSRKPKNALLINISVVGLCLTVGLYWFSMTIRLAQMVRYFMPFIIPEIIACEENKIYRRMMLAGFTIFYLMLFVFFTTGNNGVLPYRFFWQY